MFYCPLFSTAVTQCSVGRESAGPWVSMATSEMVIGENAIIPGGGPLHSPPVAGATWLGSPGTALGVQ